MGILRSLKPPDTIKMATRSAALKLDWTKVTSSLGLRGQTVSSLQAFKKRNEDARRRLQVLSEQPTTVDFAAYRSQLKNTAIVDEIEKRFKDFKPTTYDVNRQLKAIDAFEVEAQERRADQRARVQGSLDGAWLQGEVRRPCCRLSEYRRWLALRYTERFPLCTLAL